MKKGFVWAAFLIPLIFTITVVSVVFISLKGTIIRVVDLEFGADNAQTALNTLLTSSAFDSDSNREQTFMEFLGENRVGINPQVEAKIDAKLIPYSTFCKRDKNGKIIEKECTIPDFASFLLERFNQLIFTRCYLFEIDEEVVIDSSAKIPEAIRVTGVKECNIKFPSVTKIPLPYNPNDLSADARLRIE